MIERENIRMFITNFGVIAGNNIPTDNGMIHLEHPLRLVPNQESLVVAALFIKEDWAKFSPSNVVEISVPDSIINLYIDYESKLFGSIIMPESKSIIV